MVSSWLLNMGWLHLFLTLIAFPIIHLVVFVIINGKILLKYFNCKKLKLYTLLSYITYSISYAFFPDDSDNNTYVFFGLIHNNTFVDISYIICFSLFAAHITITILQLIEIHKAKKQIKTISN